MAKRLWDKGTKLNELVHRFTVGSDPIVDRSIIRWDILGSAAHAQMLNTIGLLKSDECAELLRELKVLLGKADRGEIDIPQELEDCHTTLESLLVEKLGDIGKKIHTGRSRNDQVLVATRLFLRAEVLSSLSLLLNLSTVIETRFEQIGQMPMPGYTHMQPAMPSSVGMWLQAFEEHVLDVVADGFRLYDSLNCNPLGVGSGFGIPFPLDRKLTAELLGFARVQRNPIHVQNTRGRFELKAVRWLGDVCSVVEKLACDMMLFSMKEFGFFVLPDELTTGSSIMPQKHNPDVLELLRASCSKVRGREAELSSLIAKLPSSYHRDFQFTKEPVVRAFEISDDVLVVAREVLGSFAVNEECLRAAMCVELYSTYDAYREVKLGVPFRTAYLNAADRLKKGEFDPRTVSAEFESIQSIVRIEAEEAKKVHANLAAQLQQNTSVLKRVEQDVFKM